MPYNYDLYNEQIPEMSSDREASSFHTKKHLFRSSRDGGKVGDAYYDGTETNSDDGGQFVGSIRQTDATRLKRSHDLRGIGSNIESSRATKLVYVPPGEVKIERSLARDGLFMRMDSQNDELMTNKSRTLH